MIYSGSCDSTNCYSSTPHTPNSGEQIFILLIATTTIIIIITRPKPPYGRQGLTGSWGKDTVRQIRFGAFSTSHFAPSALSSDLIALI